MIPQISIPKAQFVNCRKVCSLLPQDRLLAMDGRSRSATRWNHLGQLSGPLVGDAAEAPQEALGLAAAAPPAGPTAPSPLSRAVQLSNRQHATASSETVRDPSVQPPRQIRRTVAQ